MLSDEIKTSFILDGIETEGYDKEAIAPVYISNMCRSKFSFPQKLKLSSKIRIRFRKPCRFVLWTPLAVDKDYNIYFSALEDTELCQPDGHILKINPDGQVCTFTTFKNRDCEYAILGSNHKIYCLSGRFTFEREDCYLHCFNINGELEWQYAVGVNAYNPILDNEGNIYIIYDVVEGYDRHTVLLSLNNIGQVRWNYHFSGVTRDVPIISAATGEIYLSCSGTIYSFDKKGTIVWTVKYSNSHDFFSVISEDGSLIFTTDRDLCSIDKTGSLLWTYHSDETIKLRPGIDSKGNIYISSSNNRLISFNKDGEIRWNRRLVNHHISMPLIVDKNDNVLVQTVGAKRSSSCNFEIYSSEGERLQIYSSRGNMNSTILLDDGVLCTLLYYPYAGGKKTPNFNNSAMEIQIFKSE